MPSPSPARTVSEHFAEIYARPRSSAACKVEHDVFGGSIQAVGHTTRRQANWLIAMLGFGPSDHLLELGSGRGWPGVWLASRSGCRLVQTDPQIEATVADGRALPFSSGTFDAVSHSDALC